MASARRLRDRPVVGYPGKPQPNFSLAAVAVIAGDFGYGSSRLNAERRGCVLLAWLNNSLRGKVDQTE